MINLKKSFLYPVKQIEFLGLILDTEKMSLVLSEKKNKAYVSTMSGNFNQPKTCFKSRKVNKPAVIYQHESSFNIFNRY